VLKTALTAEASFSSFSSFSLDFHTCVKAMKGFSNCNRLKIKVLKIDCALFS